MIFQIKAQLFTTSSCNAKVKKTLNAYFKKKMQFSTISFNHKIKHTFCGKVLIKTKKVKTYGWIVIN